MKKFYLMMSLIGIIFSGSAAEIESISSVSSLPRFVWVNAGTDTDIQTINDGDILYLVPGVGYTVRYEPATAVGSVVFIGARTENEAPYAIAGDNNGNYNPWNGATPGNKAITAVSYSGNNGSGTVLATSTVTFTLVSAPSNITFTLVNANNNTDVGPLTNGQTVNLASIGTNKLNIRANSDFPGTSSVVFDFNGVQNFRTENEIPYALFGDNNGNYAVHHFAPGTYTVGAVPYTGHNGSGTAGVGNQILFYVISGGLRVSTYPNPIDNSVQVIFDDAGNNGQYEAIISDYAGREIYKGTHNGQSALINLQNSQLTTGVYFLKIIKDGETEVLRLFKN